MASEIDARIEYLGTNPSPDTPILTTISLSFIGHCIIFYFLPISITPLIKSYIVSTIHASVCIIAICIFYTHSSINVLQINRILGGGIKGTNDELMTYSMCYTCGYFIYDLFIMILFKSVRTRSALIHHIVILTAVLSGIYTHVCHSSHFLMLAEELSTVPLNLKTIYHQHMCIHEFLTYLFVATFILSRLVYGTIVSTYTFQAVPRFIQMASNLGDTTSIVLVIAQIFMFSITRILNIYWTILIVRKMIAVFRRKTLVAINNGKSKEKTS